MSKRCHKNESGISEQTLKLGEEQYENRYVNHQKEVSKLGKSISEQTITLANIWTFYIRINIYLNIK